MYRINFLYIFLRCIAISNKPGVNARAVYTVTSSCFYCESPREMYSFFVSLLANFW